jgi:hypothetical protein
MTKVKKNLTEMIAGGSSVDGNPSFRGGPYGIGNRKQLAAYLNPATAKIAQQEQDEVNQNIEDQSWLLSKFKSPSDDQTKKTDIPDERVVTERQGNDMFYKGLPGNYRENALEYSQNHMPEENFMVDTHLAGHQDESSAKYLIDDIIDDLEEREKSLSESDSNFYYQQKSALPPQKKDIGHINLNVDKDKHYSMGYGAVLSPKSFIPDEYPQQSKMKDEDMDGISDDIDLNQKSELQQMTNESIKRLRLIIRNELIKELKK